MDTVRLNMEDKVWLSMDKLWLNMNKENSEKTKKTQHTLVDQQHRVSAS